MRIEIDTLGSQRQEVVAAPMTASVGVRDG
jgi:hypothetical protein